MKELIKKIGIERRVHTAGKNKSTLDPFLDEKPEDIERLKKIQLDLHEQFINLVKNSRKNKLPERQDDSLFSGEFWSGIQSKELGLVDGLGNMEDIIQEKFGKKVLIKKYDKPEGWLKKKLSNIKGVSTEIVNLIIRNTNLDRNKVNNEVDKIISCFQNSSLDFDKVNALLNQETNDDFNLLKDEALNGNKNRTNQLLSDTVFSAENNIYYLNLINQRIQKLLIIENLKQSGQNTEAVISNLKPPVFWKDKPMILSQSRKWNKEKIQNALKKTLEIEIDLKTKNIRNKDVLIKNLIVELCVSANAS